MKFKVIIEQRALKEALEAYHYYEEKLKGLGERFQFKLNEGFSTLSKNPYFQIRYKKSRFLPIKKFPFVLIFKIDELNKEVRIYAVFNTHQNPKKRIQ